MKKLITFERYLEVTDNFAPLTKEDFKKYIFHVEKAIHEFTNGKINILWDDMSEYEKTVLEKSMAYTLEWWREHYNVLLDFGMFTKYGIGDFDVEVPSMYENRPREFWKAMRVPAIAKTYLEETRFCNKENW